MRKFLRWGGIALAVLGGLLLVGFAYVYFESGRILARRHQAVPEHLPKPSAAMLADGPRHARILGCVSCHGEGLTGKRLFKAPGVAEIWAPNLTEVAAVATDQQLAAAIRQGIGHDGRPLFVMPSGLFSRLNDDEAAALVAFIRAQPRSGKPTPPIAIGPLGRLAIVKGSVKQQPDDIPRFAANWPYELGPKYAAGRRIAATVCAECHGPDLTGRTMEDGNKPPDLSIVGAYDFDQFKRLMRTGKGPSGRDLGLMGVVGKNDTTHLTDQEIGALYDYLKARAERVTQ